MKKILFAILVGLGLAVIFFLSTMVAVGACHCTKPTIIVFPYSSIAFQRPVLEVISLPLMIIQFPVYSIVLGVMKSRAGRSLALIILLALHVGATIVGLNLYRP
jgi:hypothetical protein